MIQMQVGCPHELTLRHVITVPAPAASLIETKVHHALDPHRRRGEWFDVDADTAYRTIHKVADPIMDELAADLGRPESCDLETLINRQYVSPWAREAVAAYKAGGSSVVRRYERIIHNEAGVAALAAFRAAVLGHAAIERALGKNPSAVREARLALIDGLNVAAAIFAGDRERKLLDEISKIDLHE